MAATSNLRISIRIAFIVIALWVYNEIEGAHAEPSYTTKVQSKAKNIKDIINIKTFR